MQGHGFDLEKYLNHSKKVDVTDLDFAAAARYPISDDEVRCLTYMMDIESHTIVYLKGILNTCAVRDPQTTAFLSCWAYEEFFHGRTIGKFLEACGMSVAPDRVVEVQKKTSWREWFEQLGAAIICQISDHFHGVYLTWGAISELTTLEGYGILAGRTANPVLASLLRLLAKDERRHFSFYYNKAKEQLTHRNAQRLTAFILRKFWLPVGEGVKPDSEVDWMNRFILGDSLGAQVAERIDATIAKLPGMDWFKLMSRTRADAIRRLGPLAPAALQLAPETAR